MGYVFLGLAIIACVAGSSALTASDGMVIKKYSVYVTEILLPVTHDSEEFNYLGGEIV